MRIDTDIRDVIVEIDDEEFTVAAKTIDIAEKLRKAEDAAAKAGKWAYELWREHLEVVLGKAAVRKLFSSGRAENLDRMEAIYYGVMAAFNANGRDQRAERNDETVSEAKAVADALKPLADLMAVIGKTPETEKVLGFPTIKRPE